MVDHKLTYQQQAEQYDLLVSREDHKGNLLPAIQKCCKLEGRTVVDLGAGTGRISRLIAPIVKDLFVFDLSAEMLKVARNNLIKDGWKDYFTAAADHRNLPIAERSVDVVIAGWSFCYLADWYPETWRSELDKGLTELERILKKTGEILIIETEGTGFKTPHPPPQLEAYFVYLSDKGFFRSWVRTDYRFFTMEEAIRTSRFFFGEELAKEVEQKQWLILPECTGLWFRSVSKS